ncbi:Proteasomal ATPase-associated factor 1 [Modicella reniformis]|uniref:Proteasomal ATPase-associated factor 1 n=1 Tax=Modicella reniformis TaxID=1440133 RepID=A0A9P6IKP3_9FUNG|nr:Proteasomal ATPase-associated factor 1 [Modicella reniformis]
MGIEGSPPTALVQITVQADWTDVVTEALRSNSTGTFWISCYKRGSPSVHGTAKVSAGENERKALFTGHDGVDVETITNYSFKVKVPEYDGFEVEVYGSGRRSNISKISCLDVSPEGALFVVGSEDGTIRIGETESERITVTLASTDIKSIVANLA